MIRNYCFLQDSLEILCSKPNSEKHAVRNCARSIMGAFISQDSNAKEDVGLELNIYIFLESRE